MDQAEAVRQLLHYGLSSTELLARAAQRRRAVDERHPGTLGVGAVAAAMGCHPRTIHRWISNGRLVANWTDDGWHVPRTALGLSEKEAA
jgi:hypothetical protein